MNPLCKINVKCIMYHLIFRGSRFLPIFFLNILSQFFCFYILARISKNFHDSLPSSWLFCIITATFCIFARRMKRKRKREKKENRENYRCSQRAVSLQTLQQILRIQFFASNFRLRGYVNCLCREPVHPD